MKEGEGRKLKILILSITVIRYSGVQVLIPFEGFICIERI
jgi:hypothetical protein